MDLATNYLGLRLKNPLVASASPMGRNLATVRTLEDNGIAAVVLPSLFQEEIDHELGAHDHFREFATDSFAEATTYAPQLDYMPRGPDEYLAHLAAVKEAVEIPVMASLNGATLGGWIEYATLLEQAGADALELNIYLMAADPRQDAQQVEDRYIEIFKAVKNAVSMPVALKLGPYFSSLANFAVRLDREGVDGLVLFNRFYQPDIDLETLEVIPDLALSARHEMRVPLRWIAVLDSLIDASIAATTGVYTASDVLKMLLVGADVTMLCATLLQHGAAYTGEILRALAESLEEREYTSVKQLQGSMNYSAYGDAGALERANYRSALARFV